jgi:hypothetical protein
MMKSSGLPLLTRLQTALTPQRQSYAWIAGGALWLGWLLSILLGRGNVDFAGQAIGTDYLQFYAAGLTLRMGDSARLYDLAYQAQLEQTIIGPELQNYHAFITPPFLAWLYVPFAVLPYPVSFWVWSAAGILILLASLRALGLPLALRSLAFILSWFPVFASVSFGQNSLLSLGVLCLAYWLWQKERRFLAGLACSLILYKPQLALGLGMLWLLEWRKDWRALVGFGAGGLALAGLSFGLLPDASLAYVQFARTVLPDLPAWENFPLWHLHTVRGFWRLLLPDAKWLADGLSATLAIAGLGAFIRFWRRVRPRVDLLFAGAITLTLWITPHAMIYDWVILLIPAVLIWKTSLSERSTLKVIFSLVWVAAFLSGPLTLGQLRLWGFAIQISVPFLALAIGCIFSARLPQSKLNT